MSVKVSEQTTVEQQNALVAAAQRLGACVTGGINSGLVRRGEPVPERRGVQWLEFPFKPRDPNWAAKWDERLAVKEGSDA